MDGLSPATRQCSGALSFHPQVNLQLTAQLAHMTQVTVTNALACPHKSASSFDLGGGDRTRPLSLHFCAGIWIMIGGAVGALPILYPTL